MIACNTGGTAAENVFTNVDAKCDYGVASYDTTSPSVDVSERIFPSGNNVAASCSLPQCDTCLASLQTSQIPLVPASFSVNSVPFQLNYSSQESDQTLSKHPQRTSFTCPHKSVADVQRKVSVISNQSTLSTDSDYVSDPNNLYFDGRTRKLSDVQNRTELPGTDIFHFSKPASYNLNLNFSTAYAKSTTKDQFCQTPEFSTDCFDPRSEIRATNFPHHPSSPLVEEEGSDSGQRRISNVSAISSVSSLSVESTKLTDSVATEQEIASAIENSRSVKSGEKGSEKFSRQFRSISQVSWPSLKSFEYWRVRSKLRKV